MKAIERRIPDPDRLLILPKALSELGDRRPQVKSDGCQQSN
jgi:hypothetical protein